jgi:hypothetical protein
MIDLCVSSSVCRTAHLGCALHFVLSAVGAAAEGATLHLAECACCICGVCDHITRRCVRNAGEVPFERLVFTRPSARHYLRQSQPSQLPST